MSLTLTIRKAEGRDAKVLADIGFAAWEHSILPLLRETPGLRLVEKRRLLHAAQETLDRIIVAEIGGEVVGWCSRARGRAYIPFLFVLPDLHNQGIDSSLLRRMESMLEFEGAGSVFLETPADNVRAVRFYEKQGYRIMALKPDGRPNREPLSSVRLEKPLRPYKGAVGSE